MRGSLFAVTVTLAVTVKIEFTNINGGAACGEWFDPVSTKRPWNPGLFSCAGFVPIRSQVTVACWNGVTARRIRRGRSAPARAARARAPG